MTWPPTPCSHAVGASFAHANHCSCLREWRGQTTEKEIIKKERNTVLEEANDEVLYKIDIPANRYDMLCVEGIARALNIFRGTVTAPKYKLADMTGKLDHHFAVLSQLRCLSMPGLEYSRSICTAPPSSKRSGDPTQYEQRSTHRRQDSPADDREARDGAGAPVHRVRGAARREAGRGQLRQLH